MYYCFMRGCYERSESENFPWSEQPAFLAASSNVTANSATFSVHIMTRASRLMPIHWRRKMLSTARQPISYRGKTKLYFFCPRRR